MCLEFKNINLFSTKNGKPISKCKSCRCKESKKYRELNPEKSKESLLKVYKKNRLKILEQKKIYYELNKTDILNKSKIHYEKNKTHILHIGKTHRDNNVEHYKQKYKERWKNNKVKLTEIKRKRDSFRMKNDTLFRLKRNIKGLIGMSFKRRNYKKTNRTENILGCSISEFRNHLESKFTDGMTWENRSEWHIDHIKPLATAKTIEDIIKLNHYTNMQPLWAIDNILKKDKYIE